MPQNHSFPDGTPIDSWFFDTAVPTPQSLGKLYSLDAYGIADDGKIHTEEIQNLIEQIYQEGGGVLTVPAGTYRTGALFFRPNVHLYVMENGILLGSDNILDYPVLDTRIEGESCKYFAALINADHCDGFTVLGPGTIDGNGERSWKSLWNRRKWNPACTNKDEQRARLIAVSNSSNLLFAEITLQNAQFWTTHLYKCDHAKYLNCRIMSPHEPVRAPSTDAIDLDACTDVLVKNCYMNVNDDAIALKGGKGPWADTAPENGSNERILIEDCHYGFCHGCLTLGSESIHCRNVLLRRIQVDSGYNLLWLKMRPDTPQHYEYISVEDIRGEVTNFIQIRPWKQFFNLGDRKDIPLSYADHIAMQRCQVRCKIQWHVQPDPSQYVLSSFTFADLDVTAEKVGSTEWLQDTVKA